MEKKKKFFSYLDEPICEEDNFGNKPKILVIGKGDISIQSKDGTIVSISSIYFMPRLFWNLLSIG